MTPHHPRATALPRATAYAPGRTRSHGTERTPHSQILSVRRNTQRSCFTYLLFLYENNVKDGGFDVLFMSYDFGSVCSIW